MTCTIIRSARKTLALEVTAEGRVLIRAPEHCTDDEIRRFADSHRAWLQKALDRQRRRQAAHPEPTPEQQAELVRQAKAILPGKVAHWAAVMGLTPATITITGARTRFGSCSGKNRLSFSWRLMQYPEAAIDYVVVHELAHIAEKNHSIRFYALVARYLPDYRDREALLKG